MSLLNFNFRKKQNFNSYFHNVFGSSTPKWLNFNTNYDILTAINNIPEAYLVINYMASAFSNGKWRLYKDNEVVIKHEILDLLNSPNPLQAGKEWIKQAYAYWKAIGNEFLYTPLPIGYKDVNYNNVFLLWNLPSQHVKIVPTGKIWMQKEVSDIINNYVFSNPNGGEISIPTNQIMHKNDLQLNFDGGSYLSGQSRFVALRKLLSNLGAAYEAKNVLFNKRGALGILSNQAQAGGMPQPISPKEKKEIENNLLDYGLTTEQSQIIVTSSPLNYQRISMDMRELEINTEIIEDFITICNSFGISKELFGSQKGTTFANKNEAKKQFYQDTIIPDSEDFAMELTRYLKLDIDGYRLDLDYSHIAILQEDQETKSRVAKTKSEIILNIQASVFNATTTKEQGIKTLMFALDISEDEAENLLG